jgi:hypothetical protein
MTIPGRLLIVLLAVAGHSSLARATTYFVNGSCAGGGDGTTDTCGGVAGAFKTLQAAHDAAGPGDLIRVHAGSFEERVVFTRGGAAGSPITWETFGDGDVIWSWTGAVPAWTGAMVYADTQTGASFVTFRGSPAGYWVWQGAQAEAGAVVLYGGAAGTRTTDWTFQFFKIRDNQTRAGTFAAWHLTFEDFEVTGNATGMVFLADDANRGNPARPWSGHVVRRGKLLNNNSGGNDDGLIVQDLDGFLIEQCEISGQYDGFDSGSQLQADQSPVGPRWIIARFNRATGSNGVMPCSTVLAGPVALVYNSITGNGNWGAMPVYENSGNVHIWNNTFVNNKTPVNFQRYQLPAGDWVDSWGPLHFVANLCKSGPNGSGCLDANNQAVFKRRNYLAGTSHANPATLGEHDQTGGADSIAFGDDTTFYPITAADTALIDQGELFFLTASAGSDTTTVPLAAAYPGGPTDPRTFFWIGDRVQIAGAGTNTITALGAASLTLSQPATFAAGAGVHYPYAGVAPDIGRSEYPGDDDTAPATPQNLRVEP